MSNTTNNSILGQVGNLGKQIGKDILGEAKKVAKTATSQIGIEVPEKMEGRKPQQQRPIEKRPDQHTKDIVKSLYGLSDKNNPKTQSINTAEAPPNQSPEEVQKMAKLRQELHRTTYYQPLINRPKQQEERPVEKVEREEGEKRWELKEKEKKKPPPLAVQREQKKIEQFPGASG